jgi:hypothetical protein
MTALAHLSYLSSTFLLGIFSVLTLTARKNTRGADPVPRTEHTTRSPPLAGILTATLEQGGPPRPNYQVRGGA